MTIEAEIGVKQLKPRNTNNCWPVPKAERGQRGFYPASWREHGPADTLVPLWEHIFVV